MQRPVCYTVSIRKRIRENTVMQKIFGQHDHQRCVAHTVAAVEAVAAGRGLRLTETRRRVLEILLEEHRALGAYEVLARMAAEGFGAHPPVAYRALDFLVEHGFAHRIEAISAYVACSRPDRRHRPAFLFCRGCRLVAELDAPGEDTLAPGADDVGFRIEHMVVETQGLCSDCADTAP